MLAPALPHDEAQRLDALRSLQLLDSAPEERFDTLTRVAAHVFAVPISVLTGTLEPMATNDAAEQAAE